MKIQFDSNQSYQLEAIKAAVRIFTGQPLVSEEAFDFHRNVVNHSTIHHVIANQLLIKESELLKNIQEIQSQNNIKVSTNIIPSLSTDNKTEFTRLNFTVEMETGTGKTYTFLRSIFELNKTYGFKKFVIVVPSVAIREGTIKNLEITSAHFQKLYNNISVSYIMYDRKNLAGLRNFATANTIQILVINVDSFTKDNNIINAVRESGEKLITYIQSTNPIVILDEPQNFETDVRRQAIANLHPLCTFRYSATHRNLYNLIYSLNPKQAYDLGLVKQIEVDGISTVNNFDTPFIHFKNLELAKNNLTVKLNIFINEKNTIKQKDLTVNIGDDLFKLSNHCDVYQSGFILNRINSSDGSIEFLNGKILRIDETLGDFEEAVMKYQIERTVYWHFRKLKMLKNKQIKVLSLFFIDKVANYRSYDADGKLRKGKFADWFEEIFKKYQSASDNLIPFNVQDVHNGYFSVDKVKSGKDKENIWIDTKGATAKDDSTYNLIMKDKERLLSLEEPLQFIFSHSALREGWDNPNVFQICTLNESKSELKKRQEIGRGLRLAVNAEGLRSFDKQVNVLTIVANDTYESFSKALQKEIQEESSVDFGQRINNTKNKVSIRFNSDSSIFRNPFLMSAINKLAIKSIFSVRYESPELWKKSIESVLKMPPTTRPTLESKTARLYFASDGIQSELLEDNPQLTETDSPNIPDVYNFLQKRLDITRGSIYHILIASNRFAELKINPPMFLDNFVDAVQTVIKELSVDGIYYEKNERRKFEPADFAFEEVDNYLTQLFEVTNFNKSVFNYIEVDNLIERNFAKDCESADKVKFYFKLPKGYFLETPVGNYTPTWALIIENGGVDKLYVVDNYSEKEYQTASNQKNLKIRCAFKHFELFKSEGIYFRLAEKLSDLLKNL